VPSLRFTRFLLLGSVFVASLAGQAFAGNDTVLPPPTNVPAANRPPKFLPGPELRPPGITDVGSAPGPVVRVGREVRVRVAAEDPEGDPLTYAASGLPKGATFDAKDGLLVWKPTPEEVGNHEIVFEASDGRSVAKQTTVLVVRPNRAPLADAEDALFFVAKAKSPLDNGPSAVARDFDADAVHFVVKKKPPGLRVETMGDWVGVTWQPGDGDVGEHELVVTVSDGELETTVARRLVVMPSWVSDDYHGYLLLGGGPSGFVAHDDGELFLGGAVDVTFVALTERGTDGYLCREGKRRDECHASHHRFYAAFEVLDSMKNGAPSLFSYAAGYSAGFEYYPGRRFLVPHYGIELGGLLRDGLGHRVQTTPYLGLHLYADRHIWLNATLGYRVVPTELYDLSGPAFSLRAVVNPW
jgi:hypothetical protein